MEHDSATMGAALAFYTVFSVAPILIIAIGVIGIILEYEMVPQCRARMNEYEKNEYVTQPFVDGDISLKQIGVTMNGIGEHKQAKERYRDAGGRRHETASHWQGK